MKLFFIFFISLLITLSSLSKEHVFRVKYLRGDVWQKTNQGNIKVTNQTSLTTPFSLSSEKGSLAVLKNTKMTFRIDESSSMRISENQLNTVSLKNGSVLIRYVKSQFIKRHKLKVKTESLAVGVRGTTFFVFSDLEGKSFVSVDEGIVETKGVHSKDYVEVKNGFSSILNNKKQNLQPKKFKFQKYINWNLDKFKKKLTNNSKLKKSFLEVWNNYKDEQEYRWNKYKENQTSSWENWKKSNQ